jgi:hypothetical protein
VVSLLHLFPPVKARAFAYVDYSASTCFLGVALIPVVFMGEVKKCKVSYTYAVVTRVLRTPISIETDAFRVLTVCTSKEITCTNEDSSFTETTTQVLEKRREGTTNGLKLDDLWGCLGIFIHIQNKTK